MVVVGGAVVDVVVDFTVVDVAVGAESGMAAQSSPASKARSKPSTGSPRFTRRPRRALIRASRRASNTSLRPAGLGVIVIGINLERPIQPGNQLVWPLGTSRPEESGPPIA